MAADFIQDPRLTLIGAGFLGDKEAQDGVHLRWSFDPDLGFPNEGFQLYIRSPAPKTTLKVSFTSLARQLQQQAAPAGVDGGVTVHRLDGDRLAVGTRCNQIGLDLGNAPLVLRFRPSFGAPPGLVREVTLLGVTQGGVFARAMHHGRAADCAAIGQQTCLAQVLDPNIAARLTRLDAGGRLLAGRDLRRQHRAAHATWADVLKNERAAATKQLADLRIRLSAAATCVPFQMTLQADAIDSVLVSGCNATLLGVVWSPLARDECERGWKPLHGPICLPVDTVPAYGCAREPGDARAIAKRRIPEEVDLPPNAPRRATLESRLLGLEFDELHKSLEQALGSGGQFFAQIPSDNPEDGTTWRYDVVRDALTAAIDPYFARVLGLCWVHRPSNAGERFDYKIEATWPIDGVKRRFCWVVFGRGMEAQPVLPAPTGAAATSMPGSAHVTPDGTLNACEMDVTLNWRRPSVCEMTDPVLSPIAYLVERTDPGAPNTGPYHLATQRAFEEGAEPEAVTAMIADPAEGPERFAAGYFVDRGPGYGLFHYRVLARDLFGRTSAPSSPAAVTVKDEVPPGPPLNLVAEYFDPDDPDRTGSEILAWANRDVALNAPQRSAVTIRWIWPANRQLQYPDLDEFRLYYHAGSLNHVLGHITSVTEFATGEYTVDTDLAPVGPDFPWPQSAIDLGALRNEGEEFPILTVTTAAGLLTFRVRANPAAPPLVGPCAFRLGRGTSPSATQTARAPYPAFKSFEQAAHWPGFRLTPNTPSPPLRVAADGTVHSPLPTGLTAADVAVSRALEPQGSETHWHYAVRLRGLTLVPTPERPRAVGTFGIGSVDGASNQGRIAPPAAILAIHRVAPSVPPLVYPPVNYANRADYHGTSWFTLTWTGAARVGYLVYRAGDLDLLAAGGIDLTTHRARTADEQRLELQQLALDTSHIEVFRLVTPAPLTGNGGGMQHRDGLPGGVLNRFVYRVRAVDPGGTLAPWPPASSGSCVVVDLPGVPPASPVWADASFPVGGVVLRWLPNVEASLRGYRVYRAYDAVAAEDVRSMVPLFNSAQAEGNAVVTGVILTRDTAGAIISVAELAAGDQPPGRFVQLFDTTAEPGRSIYYRLVAEDRNGNRSAPSERLVVTLPKTQPPEPPVLGAPVVTSGQIALQWTAPEDDLECLVMRRSGSAIWRSLGPWGPRGDYAFVDANIEAGAEYDYRVRVRDRIGLIVDSPLLHVTAI